MESSIIVAASEFQRLLGQDEFVENLCEGDIYSLSDVRTHLDEFGTHFNDHKERERIYVDGSRRLYLFRELGKNLLVYEGIPLSRG